MSKTAEGQETVLAAGLAYSFTDSGPNREGVIQPLTLTPEGALRVSNGEPRSNDFSGTYFVPANAGGGTTAISTSFLDGRFRFSPLWASGLSFYYALTAGLAARLSSVYINTGFPPNGKLVNWSGADLLQPNELVIIRPGIDNSASSALLPSRRYSLPVVPSFGFVWVFSNPVPEGQITLVGGFLP